MKFSEIIGEISGICECTMISNLINTDIAAIKLIDTREDSFDGNTLYFGYSIQSLKDIPCQFVSIRSEDAASALHDKLNVQNLALISEEDFSHAFNEANHIFERIQRTAFYNTMMETLNRV